MSNEVMERDPTINDDRKEELKKPRMWCVVLHNDDFTPMEFVSELLERLFRKSHEEAERITMEVHKRGKGVAGVYTFGIAETKCAQVLVEANREGHPLQPSLEPMD